MALVRPFQATRYRDPSQLKDVTCPPYDVLNEELIQHYRSKSPYNAVYLSRNPKETPQSARYDHVAALLDAWHDQNILTKDPKDLFYLEKETFVFDGHEKTRHGVYALVDVSSGKSRVIRHEHTLNHAIEDRLQLLRQTQTHLSPIFMIADDPQGEFYNLCQQAPFDPLDTFSSEDGVTHTFGIVDDPQTHSDITGFFDTHDLLIADGHHRYKTAMDYAEETKKPAYVLAFVVSSVDPGLVLSSIHRMVASEQSPSAWIKAHTEYFQTCPLGADAFQASKAPFALVDHAFETMYLWKGNCDEIPSVLFQREVLEKRMNIDLRKKADQTRVKYFKHNYDLQKASTQKSSLTFWLKPMQVFDVIEVCKNNQILPQKTTYFFPKVLDGLVFFEL